MPKGSMLNAPDLLSTNHGRTEISREVQTMSLWGCQVGSSFLSCAGTMYSDGERMLLGATVMAAITLAAYIVVRLANPR